MDALPTLSVSKPSCEWSFTACRFHCVGHAGDVMEFACFVATEMVLRSWGNRSFPSLVPGDAGSSDHCHADWPGVFVCRRLITIIVIIFAICVSIGIVDGLDVFQCICMLCFRAYFCSLTRPVIVTDAPVRLTFFLSQCFFTSREATYGLLGTGFGLHCEWNFQ